jgi:hypothetical protein
MTLPLLLAGLLLQPIDESNEQRSPAEEPTDGCPFGLIGFDEGSAELTATARARLDAVSDNSILTYGGWLNIQGRINAREEALNLSDLDRRRGESIRQYLLQRGLDAVQIRVSYLGNSQPVSGGPAHDHSPKADTAIDRAATIFWEAPMSVYRRIFPPGIAC